MTDCKQNLLTVAADIHAHINLAIKANRFSGALNYPYRAVQGTTDTNSLLHAALLCTEWNRDAAPAGKRATDLHSKLLDLLGIESPLGVLGPRASVLSNLALETTAARATKRLRQSDYKEMKDNLSDMYLVLDYTTAAVRSTLHDFYHRLADTVSWLHQIGCLNQLRSKHLQPEGQEQLPKTTFHFVAQLLEATKKDSTVWSSAYDMYDVEPHCGAQLHDRADALIYDLTNEEDAGAFGEEGTDFPHYAEMNRLRPFDVQMLFFLAYFGEQLSESVDAATRHNNGNEPNPLMSGEPIMLLMSSNKGLQYYPTAFHLQAAHALLTQELTPSQWKPAHAFCTQNVLLGASPQVMQHLASVHPETFRDTAYPDELDSTIENLLESEKLLIVELVDAKSKHYQARIPLYPCRDPSCN